MASRLQMNELEQKRAAQDSSTRGNSPDAPQAGVNMFHSNSGANMAQPSPAKDVFSFRTN